MSTPGIKAYAAQAAGSPLAPWTIRRREPTPDDVAIEILFCGGCDSDLHTVRNDWQGATFPVVPVVPGHEIVGRVVAVGKNVTKFTVGDIAAVVCVVGFMPLVLELPPQPRAILRNVSDPHLQQQG